PALRRRAAPGGRPGPLPGKRLRVDGVQSGIACAHETAPPRERTGIELQPLQKGCAGGRLAVFIQRGTADADIFRGTLDLGRLRGDWNLRGRKKTALPGN